MSEEFENLEVKKATTEELGKIVKNLRGVPEGLTIDPAFATALQSGERQWTFFLTREAIDNWDQLGQMPVKLGILVHQFGATDEPHVQRTLVLFPEDRGKVKLEMRDSVGRILWSGSGQVKGDELEFSMPITRPRVRAKGMMAGRINAKGRLTLSEARLPKPTQKKEPTFVSED
jgi:hypothetical protein